MLADMFGRGGCGGGDSSQYLRAILSFLQTYGIYDRISECRSCDISANCAYRIIVTNMEGAMGNRIHCAVSGDDDDDDDSIRK